jgi:predicted transcriptional regulator
MGIEEYGNRNSYDIIADILGECKVPIRKTPLMAKASASKVTLDKILRLCLMDPSLLEKCVAPDGAVFYQITQLGFAYLDTYESLMRIAKPSRVVAPAPMITA